MATCRESGGVVDCTISYTFEVKRSILLNCLGDVISTRRVDLKVHCSHTYIIHKIRENVKLFFYDLEAERDSIAIDVESVFFFYNFVEHTF